MNASERAFLDASADEAARELRDAHRRARRLRWTLVGVAALLVVAVVAGVLFVGQRDRAERVARDATARKLASEASGAIDEDPELAMLLALEAVSTTERAGADPLPEAVASLQQSTQASRLLFRREAAGRFVDVSSDGSRIATASADDDGAALIWDAATGDQLRTLPGPDPSMALSDLRFGPDGRLLAVLYANETEGAAIAAILWDTVTGEEVARLQGSDDSYTGPAFSPDGRRLAAVSAGGDDNDDRLTMWDVAAATELFAFELAGLGGRPEFVPDDERFLLPGSGFVGIYSSDDGRLLDEIPTPGFGADQVALHVPSGLLALGSQRDREVQIRNFPAGTLARRVTLADVGPLDWTLDGARLAIAGANQTAIRIVDVSSGQDPLVLRGHESGSWGVAFIAAGDRLASVGQNGELRVWDVTPEGPPALRAVTPRSGTPWGFDISPDGSELFVATGGRAIERLSADGNELLAERAGQMIGQWPYVAPVTDDWRLAASVNGSDGSGAVLDATTLTPHARLPALPDCTSPLGFSPDGALLALGGRSLCAVGNIIGPFEPPAGADLRNRVIEVDSGREVLDLGVEEVPYVVFNPGGEFAAGRYLAVNVEFERVDLYDVAERRLIGTLPAPDLLIGLAFDATGQRLVGGSGGGRVWALDLAAVVGGTPAEDAIVLDQIVDDGSITGLDISADGTLATAGLGDRVKLFDLSTGELLLELRVQQSPGGSNVEFGPDGSYLMYTDGTVIRRLDRDTDELVRLARSLLTRELTPDECRQYLGGECG